MPTKPQNVPDTGSIIAPAPDNLPVYTSWPQVPAGLLTKTGLANARKKLAPGQQPVAYKRNQADHIDYPLYQAAAALDNRPASWRVVAAAKAKATYTRNRTCVKCGVFDLEVYARKSRLCYACAWAKKTAEAHAGAVRWARALLAGPTFVIIDTETTGLGPAAEVIEVTIMDNQSYVLLNQRFKPTVPIEPGATDVHGISNEAIAEAPRLTDVLPNDPRLAWQPFTPIRWGDYLAGILEGYTQIVAYNVEFDKGKLAHSLRVQGLGPLPETLPWQDAQRVYAAYCGEWSRRYNGWRLQRLPGGDHTALGDVNATLALIKKMAATQLPEEGNADNN